MTATLMLSSFLAPAEALRAGPSVVGGKAHALARLTDSGLNIPPWLVIPATVLHEHLAHAGFGETVRSALVTIRSSADDPRQARAAIVRAARVIPEIIDTLPLRGSLRDDFAEVAERLAPGLFAVRSSAIDEDGERHSWAGQFESVLGAADITDLEAAVRRCWRSAFSERALNYRCRTNSLDRADALAVIVQRLIAADVSGVLFTIDPVTGDEAHMRVSACWGLGERLVSGADDADEYVLTREGKEVSARIAHKPRRIVAGIAAEQAVPNALRDARTLDAGTLQRLGAAGKRIADQERGARDIEWAIQGGTLFILQARPVTSKGSAPRVEISGGHRIVWDNSNIQESYFGVTTPLTFSFASAAYASVYEQTMRALGIPERVIATHRSMLANLLGLIRGRVYYNLNNWYRGLLLLPAFHRNKSDMERMMGVEEPVDFVEDTAPSALARVRRTPRLLSTMARMVARFATLPTNSACFLEEVDTTLGSIDRDGLAGRPLAELMWLLDRLRRECIDRWTTPIVNDFYVMMTTGKLRRLVARALPREVENVMQVLLGGADVATSAGPAMMLLRMAEFARGDTTLAHVLRTREGADALNAARDTNADFAATYAALVHRFGDRCMGELKLESRPLRDDPRFVLRMLRNYLETTPPNSDALAARAWAERQRVEWRVAGNLGILSRRRFHRALNAARRGIRMREEMRLARTRLFGVHRDIYKAIGARLHASGRLATPHDVFYLTTTEIEAYWEGTAVSTDLASIAAARRREFAAYATLPAPNRIVTEGAPADGLTSDGALAMTSATVADGMVLHGLGCSPGIAEGPVRIITSPTDELTLAGHILVAPRTDPGWAPLFPSAAAIVVERGSLLSHSAVLARELGLPAVVSIPGVVGLLRDGERVRVDGTRGTVERLEATCAS